MKRLAAIMIASVCAAPAFAAQCPEDKKGVNVMAPGPSEQKGVTLEPIDAVDLADLYGIEGRHIRVRRLIVEPGGVIPWHGHDTRPGVFAIISGELTEYRSTCAEPMVHRPGDGGTEAGSFRHWWKNHTDEPAVAIVTDLPQPEDL